MKVRDVLKLLEDNGGKLHRHEKNHRQFKKAGEAQLVTVPGHLGDDVKTGTLGNIRKASGIREMR